MGEWMIFYLHGFRSGPQSAKVQALAARMEQLGLREHLWCEQLSPIPAQAIAQVERQLARSAQTPTFVGSSLGGFYATYLANLHACRAVLINPLVLHAQFQADEFLGEHQMIYSAERFSFTREHVDQIKVLDTPSLRHPDNFWLLAEEGDEVLDYHHALQRYQACRQTVLPGGNHSFTRWNDYLDGVIAFAGLLP